jgi:putative membrane protein
MLTAVLVCIVAVQHVLFFILESFLWTKKPGLKVFRMTEDFARSTKHLAINQGVYNLFLSAALFLGLYFQFDNSSHAFAFQVYGLVCVVVAAVVGALSFSPRILIVQGLPAALALGALLLG